MSQILDSILSKAKEHHKTKHRRKTDLVKMLWSQYAVSAFISIEELGLVSVVVFSVALLWLVPASLQALK